MKQKTMKQLLLSTLAIATYTLCKAQINDLPVSASPASICSGQSTFVSTTGSQVGVNYSLRDGNNNVVAGPTAGTGNDLSFNTGTLTSSETFNVHASTNYSALDFDGLNDYLYFDYNNRNITTQVSVAAWIRSTASGVSQFVMSKYNPTHGYCLYFNASGKAVFDGRDGLGYRSSGTSITSVNDGQWHYLTGTANIATGVWSIYVDGVLESSNANPTGTTLASSALFVGGAYYNPPNFFLFNGSIDDLSIWNTELNQSTIQANMSTCLSGSESGLAGLWAMNEGSGLYAFDASSYSLDGLLSNMDPSTDWIANATANCGSSLQMTQTATINVVTISNENVTAPASVCAGTSATVNLADSDVGASYTLRDGQGNVIDGPTAGTGSALAFNTGNLSSTTTFNVLGELNPVTSYALEFDGVNDYLNLTNGNRGVTSQMTISAWIKSSATTAQQIASKYNGLNGFLFYFDVNGKVQIDGRDGSGFYRSSGPSTTSVNDNQWHYVSGTVNTATGKWSIYVDGVLENSATPGTGPTLASSALLVAGAYHNPPTFFYFTGAIDELSIWNSELSQAGIQDAMNNCLAGTEPGVVGMFRFDQGSGSVAIDISSQPTNGTLVNMNPNADWVSDAGACWGSCSLVMSQTPTVTIDPSYNQAAAVSVCAGSSYTFPDGTTQHNITSQVTQTSNLQTVGAGCDSVIITTVDVAPSYNQSETASVCSGGSYTFPDGTTQNNITTQVSHTSNLQTVGAGCDSTIVTTVNVNPMYNQSETVSVCSGSNYTFPDGTTQNNITSQVSHTSNLQTVGAGCDSTIVTTVNVNPTYNLSQTASVCSGDSYTFPDGTTQNNITSQTSHTSNLQTTGNGCDSIIVTTVSVNPTYNETVTAYVCSGDSYTFPDGTTQSNITSHVTHTSTLQTAQEGCDSVIVTTVNVNATYSQSITVSVCLGASYTFPDGTTQTNITSQVSHTSSLQTVGAGCDSVITTTVNVYPPIDNTTNVSGTTITSNQAGATYRWLDCGNSFVAISGETEPSFTPSTSGSYAVEITLNGCVDTSSCRNVTITGLNEITLPPMTLAPNPVSDYLQIHLDEEIQQLWVFSSDGSLVSVPQANSLVDVSALSSGVYLVTVRTERGIARGRFVKQ